MKIRLLLMAAWLAATFFVVLSPVDTADAGRGGGGRGGGGGFSRSGPAAHGGFAGGASQRTARMATRQAGASERSGQRATMQQQGMTERSDLRTNRQDQITERQGQRQQSYSERQENRQDYRSEAREDWQDAANDHWDNRYYGYRAGAGAVVAAGAYAAGRATSSNVTYVTTLPCSPTTAYLNGVTYYRCGSDWYTRAYSGGNVSYTVVGPPPGY